MLTYLKAKNLVNRLRKVLTSNSYEITVYNEPGSLYGIDVRITPIEAGIITTKSVLHIMKEAKKCGLSCFIGTTKNKEGRYMPVVQLYYK